MDAPVKVTLSIKFASPPEGRTAPSTLTGEDVFPLHRPSYPSHCTFGVSQPIETQPLPWIGKNSGKQPKRRRAFRRSRAHQTRSHKGCLLAAPVRPVCQRGRNIRRVNSSSILGNAHPPPPISTFILPPHSMPRCHDVRHLSQHGVRSGTMIKACRCPSSDRPVPSSGCSFRRSHKNPSDKQHGGFTTLTPLQTMWLHPPLGRDRPDTGELRQDGYARGNSGVQPTRHPGIGVHQTISRK